MNLKIVNVVFYVELFVFCFSLCGTQQQYAELFSRETLLLSSSSSSLLDKILTELILATLRKSGIHPGLKQRQQHAAIYTVTVVTPSLFSQTLQQQQ